MYGSTDLTPEQWKQLEDQRKMRAIFEMMQAKKMQLAKLQAAGKVKYDYDSDEDDEGMLTLSVYRHTLHAIPWENPRNIFLK